MWFGERKYAWGLLGLLWIIGCVGALSRFVMAYYQAVIADDFGVGRSFISLSWSINLLIAALSAPIGGWLVDKYGAKPVLLLSVCTGAIGSLFIFLFPNPVTFFLAYGILSGLIGLGSTTSFTMIIHWFHRHRGKALTILNSASPLGLAIVTPLFVQAEELTWNIAFFLSALLSLALTIPLIAAFLRNTPVAEAEPSPPSAQEKTGKWERLHNQIAFVFATPVIPIVLLALFTCGFHMGTVEMNMVAIHQHAHVSPAYIATSVSLLGLMEVAGSFFFGYLLDKIPRALALSLMYGIRIVGFVFLFLHLDISPIVFSVLFGATYNGAVPGALLLAQEATRGSAAQTGFLLMFHQGGGITAALLAGVLFDLLGDYQFHISLDAALALLVAIGYLGVHFYLRRRRRRSDHAVYL